MPINANLLRPQIEAAAERAALAIPDRDRRLERLARPFRPGSDSAAFVAACLTAATASKSERFAGALFNVGEDVAGAFACGGPDREPPEYALLATDGSQIMPDRHKPLTWALARAAAVCIVYGGSRGPAESSLAGAPLLRFLPEDELEVAGRDGGLLSAAEINAERDLLERELMAERCAACRALGLRPIALSDGSLVPFGLLNELAWRGQGDKRAYVMLGRLMAALDRMRDAGALVAGYIERPNSAGAVHAAATVIAAGGDDVHALSSGLHDRDLFAKLLSPGQRGALFDPNWTVNGPAHLGREGHAMRAAYAYLAIGPARPNIIRIEVPEWCADPESVAALTAVITRQARLGAGYPFILKAAHEEAVLTRQDQAELDSALESAMQRHGIRLTASRKQGAKEME